MLPRSARWLQLKYFLMFALKNWGNDPIWRSYFSNKSVQPPTSKATLRLKVNRTCPLCRRDLVTWRWNQSIGWIFFPEDQSGRDSHGRHIASMYGLWYFSYMDSWLWSYLPEYIADCLRFSNVVKYTVRPMEILWEWMVCKNRILKKRPWNLNWRFNSYILTNVCLLHSWHSYGNLEKIYSLQWNFPWNFQPWGWKLGVRRSHWRSGGDPIREISPRKWRKSSPFQGMNLIFQRG